MLIKKNDKNIIMFFRDTFLKAATAREESSSNLITKDNLMFKTIDNNNFIVKERR